MTFSMCLVRSANRCSMWPLSVQMRLATNCSSKSARFMNAEKLSPSPTGSMIVKRTLPGGMRRQQAEHDGLHQVDRPAASWAARLQQQQRAARIGHQGRQREIELGRPQPLILGHAALDVGQPDRTAAEANDRRNGRRRASNRLQSSRVPIGKRLLAERLKLSGRAAEPLHARPPALGHLGPFALEALPALFQRLGMTLPEPLATRSGNAPRSVPSSGGYFVSISVCTRSRQATNSASFLGYVASARCKSLCLRRSMRVLAAANSSSALRVRVLWRA